MISIGNVVISDLDTPEKIPIGGVADAVDVKLSDGSRILKVTGFTPNDLQITGTLRENDNGMDPYTKFLALQDMARTHLPQTFILKGAKRSIALPVIVWKVNGSIVEDFNIEFDITLFQQSNSGLISTGYIETPTNTQRQAGHVAALNNIAPMTGASTQAAIQDLQSKYATLTQHGL